MKTIIQLLSASVILFFLSGCEVTPKPSVPEKVLFTQVNMWYIDRSYTQHLPEETDIVASLSSQKALHANHQIESTNYQRDHFIPVNTEVLIVGSDRNAIFFRCGDKIIALRHVRKYTQIPLQELFDRTFREQPVDLSVYSPEEKAQILSGEVTPGMGKAAILLTRGYPPEHKTPNLDADDWHYWNGRFNSRIYHFKEGKYTGYTD